MINGSNLYFSNIEKEDQVYKTFDDYKTKNESKVFAIKLCADNKIIGIAGFDDIIKSNETATIFIGIGNKELRGKGYGKESLNILLLKTEWNYL